jgi:adenylate cyclase
MIHLAAANRLKLNKLLVIIAGWLFIGFLMTLYDHSSYQSEYIASTTALYSFGKNLLFNLVAALMGALMGGIFLVYYVNEKFRQWPYGRTILAVAISFVVVVSIITFLLGIVFSVQRSGQSFFHPHAMREFEKFVTNPVHLKNILWWAPVVALTQFVLQVNDKFGQGVLWNFLKGKYHSPKEEMRIFMFVDLMASTTLAEKLGNEKYHSLLKDFFADITNAVLFNKGEIYQYVGDEVVISWKLTNGIQDNHCLQCFFDMREAIEAKKEKYEGKFGLAPDFKAGLHYGNVMAGEVGIIKRDITFSGDVLNTAARIQSKCNEYHVKILSSDELLDLLPYQRFFKKTPLGNIELKGKGQKVALSTLEVK